MSGMSLRLCSWALWTLRKYLLDNYFLQIYEIFVAKFFLTDLAVAPAQTGRLLVWISIKARSLQRTLWNIDFTSD